MKRFLALFLTAFAGLAAQDHKHSHADAPAAPGAAASGPVRLTKAMVDNLGLETAAVELRPMEKTFPALGVVAPRPDRVTAIASRVAGRVTKLHVHEGQRVQAGEVLLEVESRIVADPPPRVIFKAPADGVVLELGVLPGGTVEPERNLLTLADLSTVDVVAQVFEANLGAVRPGQPVRFTVLAHPGLTFSGTVRATAAGLERESGTLRVFVACENRDAKLLPGMRAELAFVTAQTEDAVVVPRAAVLGEMGDLFVFRQVMTAPFAYERTPVVVGLRGARDIEIIEGVLPGDRVVTRGNYPLQFVGVGAQKLEDDHGHSHGPGGHKH